VVQRIFDFQEQKCISNINVNQVLFEEIRTLKKEFKKQREKQQEIIRDLMEKEQDEKLKLNEAKRV